ncbi:MAG TPA: nucleotidyltransferase domain-containing protein, partial [Longimicrobium sp.]|nr:nucleotidyltransferase domain-containing protein [Longimicrobium sp.]
MATELAGRIAAAGRGRVRCVAMVGSRARGTAGPESDLDIVVLVEPEAGAAPWGPKEFRAERDRLRREVAAPPVRTDLWVRTPDRFEEARHVVGGVEWLVETEGVVVYRRAPDRPPVPRRTPEQVRRENVSAWVEHALLALDGTTARANASALAAGGASAGDSREAARAAVERAVNALLVAHGVAATKEG